MVVKLTQFLFWIPAIVLKRGCGVFSTGGMCNADWSGLVNLVIFVSSAGDGETSSFLHCIGLYEQKFFLLLLFFFFLFF